MTQSLNKYNYQDKIYNLLGKYEQGTSVFIDAEDWDDVIHVKDTSSKNGLPDSWLALADKVISFIAHGKYGLDTYQNILEVIDSEQMLEAYTRVGMPVQYDHWSFGKSHVQQEKNYQHGAMGLAYEIVVNTDPSIAYLMTQNTKTMQMLVIAHASYGHNSFFKGNHLFKQFTKADEIVSEMLALKEKVLACEEQYGFDAVEQLLDACHALQYHGVNRYDKPKKRSAKEEKGRREKIEEFKREHYDPVLDSGRGQKNEAKKAFNIDSQKRELGFLERKEENILRYIAAYAPHLEEWQRDIISRVSEQAQYFYPQRQTQLMNEGWASFWHYTIMSDLNDLGLINDGMYLEFLSSHTSVLAQPDFDHPHYSGINPYALGFAIFQDIKRMCEHPTEEDREFFPDIVGKDWLEQVKYAMQNFKDESFIQQYLSPKIIRDFHLFAIIDDDIEDEIEVSAIHNEGGYEEIRDALSSQYNLGDREPCIDVVQYDFRGDMGLTLQHTVRNRQLLDGVSMGEVLKHIHYLWKRPVVLNSIDADGDIVTTFKCHSDTDKNQRSSLSEMCQTYGYNGA